MLGQMLRGGLLAGTLKTGVQLGPAFAQRWDRAIERFFSPDDIGIDFLLVGKIEGDRSIHLLQGQRREVLADRLGRVTSLERIDDGIEGDASAGDIESAVTLFNVLVA